MRGAGGTGGDKQDNRGERRPGEVACGAWGGLPPGIGSSRVPPQHTVSWLLRGQEEGTGQAPFREGEQHLEDKDCVSGIPSSQGPAWG